MLLKPLGSFKHFKIITFYLMIEKDDIALDEDTEIIKLGIPARLDPAIRVCLP